MGRKRKIQKEEVKFEPSKYQQAIFDFIQNQKGDLLIEAVAGSGKTTTIVEALKLIPADKTVLFCAFNKDIVKSLNSKTKMYDNVEVRTIHGLGYMACVDNIPSLDRKINTNKYMQEFLEHTHLYTHNTSLSYSKWCKFRKNIFKLIDLARLHLVDSIEKIIDIANYYNLDLIYDEAETVLNLMKWGIENTSSIDYTDMVWYPNIFDFNLEKQTFDYIFIDEAQDLSKAQREFILKCTNGSTRYTFVGDGNQSIYGFSAADPESFNEIKKIKGITSLPLSVCYRCPKDVIDFVHPIVPNIEAQEDAIKGSVINNAKLEDIEDQDMVLCRYNAPLFGVYVKLIAQGKKTFIMGKDIGNNLIDTVKNTQFSQLNRDLKEKGVFSALYQEYFIKRNQLKNSTGWTDAMVDSSPTMIAMQDTIFALEMIASNITTSAQLIDKLSKIFSDDTAEGIILSTIHKAKGLEANNVFVVQSLNRLETKMTDWEKIQEKNLRYVAYTRPKKKLAIITNDDVCKILPNRGMTGIQDVTSYMNNIEPIITSLYSKPANSVRLKTSFGSNGRTLNTQPKRLSNTQLNNLIGKKKPKNKLF